MVLTFYLSLPNVIAVGGSWIATREEMAAGYWDAVAQKAAEAVRIGRSV